MLRFRSTFQYCAKKYHKCATQSVIGSSVNSKALQKSLNKRVDKAFCLLHSSDKGSLLSANNFVIKQLGIFQPDKKKKKDHAGFIFWYVSLLVRDWGTQCKFPRRSGWLKCGLYSSFISGPDRWFKPRRIGKLLSSGRGCLTPISTTKSTSKAGHPWPSPCSLWAGWFLHKNDNREDTSVYTHQTNLCCRSRCPPPSAGQLQLNNI